MRGMKLTETIGLVVISLLIVATTGCGNKEGKYVGTYVEEPKEVGPPGVTRRLRTVLELASDGTYKLTQGDIDHPSVTTGEWSVGKSGGEEYVEFIPFIGYSASRSKTRGYYFHDAPLGQTILAKEKQARSSQSTERIPDAAQDPISAAHRQLSYFEVALDAFEIDVGRYPTSAEGLRALIQKPTSNADGWQQAYLKSGIPQDPWGNDYIYRFPGQNNQDGYDLYSPGPDRKLGGGDDIANWSEM